MNRRSFVFYWILFNLVNDCLSCVNTLQKDRTTFDGEFNSEKSKPSLALVFIYLAYAI